MKKIIAVMGAASPTETERQLARQVGTLLGKAGCALLCGGLGGVMEAACRGAQSADGLTIGLLPGHDCHAANPYVDIVLPTGMGEARNVMVAQGGRAAIAIGGGFGTLSEIALALRAGIPVIALRTWSLTDPRVGDAPFIRTDTPETAVAEALAAC